MSVSSRRFFIYHSFILLNCYLSHYFLLCPDKYHRTHLRSFDREYVVLYHEILWIQRVPLFICQHDSSEDRVVVHSNLTDMKLQIHVLIVGVHDDDHLLVVCESSIAEYLVSTMEI